MLGDNAEDTLPVVVMWATRYLSPNNGKSRESIAEILYVAVKFCGNNKGRTSYVYVDREVLLL